MKKRSQIKEEYIWRTEDIYPSTDDLRKDIEKLKGYIPVLNAFKGKLGDKKLLLKYLQLSEELSIMSEKIGVYISLKLTENLENTEISEIEKVVTAIEQDLSVATSFEESELLSYGYDYLESLKEDKKLKQYALMFDELIRNRDHVLPESEESLVSKSMASISGYSDVYDNITTLDMKFEDAIDSKGKTYECNPSLYSKLITSNDRVLRKSAFESINNGYKSLANTISANFIGSMQGDSFIAKAYKFNSTLDANLFGTNVEELFFTNLLENVSSRANLVKKYYKLKKSALGYKNLYAYDTRVIVSKYNPKYDYEKAFNLVMDAMSVFGEEYVNNLKIAKQERWIDVEPCEKKDSGAACWSEYSVHPYVMLNHNNDMESVYTIAHEMGHAMHDVYSSANQPYHLYSPTIFLAEIASTTNEILLFKYLYKNSKNDKEKLSHIERHIGNIIGTIFTQCLYSDFEYHAHKLVDDGQAISKEILNKLYANAVDKYLGTSIKNSAKDLQTKWMQIPHFYRAFYVYKYATGMISAICFANKISSGDSDTKEKYLQFLMSGSSDYSLNILKKAGVDLMSQEPYEIMESELKWAVSEYEKLINKK